LARNLRDWTLGQSVIKLLGDEVKEHQVGLLGGFLDELGIGRVALVGHGLGALIGLAFANAQPSRIVRIMAIALPLDPTAVDGRLYASDPVDLLDLLGGKLVDAGDLLLKGLLTDARAIHASAEPMQIRGALSGLHERDIACLLIYGANDPLLRAPSPEQVAAFGSQVHQVILPDSGHFPMLDAPAAFHRLLIDFLAMEPGTSPQGLEPREEWRRRVR